jgi:hypothetical protein
MDKQDQRAKELFVNHYGSLLDMHRSGIYAEYKACNVPKETELEWFDEMIRTYSGQLSIRDWDAVDSLLRVARNYQNSVMVENVVSFASRNIMSADSMVRLMYAENMMEIISANKKVITRDLLFQACKVTIEIFEAIIAEPLVLDPGHELQQLHLRDKRALNMRSKKGVEAVMNILN